MAHFVAETVEAVRQTNAERNSTGNVRIAIPPDSLSLRRERVDFSAGGSNRQEYFRRVYQKDYKGPTIGCKVGQLRLTLFDLHSKPVRVPQLSLLLSLIPLLPGKGGARIGSLLFKATQI
jgi:hypothetical protein